DSDKCGCGRYQKESVGHFLLECHTWMWQRERFVDVDNSRWGDLLFYLGGRSEQKRLARIPF
ncbi:hypothetical protein K469DRAFT_592742, partial [Zopfia rhizophila CBS 207.26]